MVRGKEKPINTPTERAKLPQAGCLYASPLGALKTRTALSPCQSAVCCFSIKGAWTFSALDVSPSRACGRAVRCEALSTLLGEGQCPGPVLCSVLPFRALCSLLTPAHVLFGMSISQMHHLSCFHNSSRTP